MSFMDVLGGTSKRSHAVSECLFFCPGRGFLPPPHRHFFYLVNRLEVTALSERMERPWCCLTTKFLSKEVVI